VFSYNPAAKQRVIRMVEAQVDPMEPPKHKHKKVPRGPPSPPVPVLHSPPRKLTVKDQQEWKIPPCISNWKNARGYTIPLDKRLAADGRGLQETTINNKFASLSESLYVAERKAKEDLTLRNQIRKQMALREKEDKEKELREMAMKARLERAGIDAKLPSSQQGAGEETGAGASRGGDSYYGPSSSSQAPAGTRGAADGRYGRSAVSDRNRHVEDGEDDEAESAFVRRPGESDAEAKERQEREKIRIERRKERERELRLENLKVGDS